LNKALIVDYIKAYMLTRVILTSESEVLFVVGFSSCNEETQITALVTGDCIIAR